MRLLAGAPLLLLAACGGAHGKRVIVLGVDGMDPRFVERHLSELPSLRRLAALGGLSPLATTTPPESPVAWSTFITGTDPKVHGIFDFVLRDPATLEPVSSLGETIEPAHYIAIGPYLLPLASARVRQFRQGRAFWETLADHGIPVTIFRVPVNYPPAARGRELAGMGVPDLEGTFGTFTYYTDDLSEPSGDVPGGRVVQIAADGHHVVLPIEGPANPLRRDRRKVRLDLIADIDPEASAMRCQIQSHQFLLKQGEWSEWIRVRIPLIPHLASAAGMFRIYARELGPAIRIYRSPLNIDPADPALAISAPPHFSHELARQAGPFYTQGIEEDTSALRQGALTLEEYLAQSRLVFAEHRALLADCLSRFRDGLLFFYFSEIDQNSHVLWGRHEAELLRTYQWIDEALASVLAAAPDATIIVMSDHGFASFDRAVNLNTWLLREGFLAVETGRSLPGPGPVALANVDWTRTKAYAMGLNSLYINLAGREKHGIVHPGAERDALARELARRLLEFRDPEAPEAAPVRSVSMVGKTSSRYAPDLIVGYAPGYRASWETALGAVPADVVRPNQDAWIGDHCIAADAVPGVLLGNRRPRLADPGLKDLAPTILREFGLPPSAAMTGRPIY